jgi:hypothetical protein
LEAKEMDLRVYYRKIREAEQTIDSDFPVVVSLETSDGGRGGITTEVPRSIAAKMFVEGKARLATLEETKEHNNRSAELLRLAKEKESREKLHITVISDSEMRSLKNSNRAPKQ